MVDTFVVHVVFVVHINHVFRRHVFFVVYVFFMVHMNHQKIHGGGKCGSCAPLQYI